MFFLRQRLFLGVSDPSSSERLLRTTLLLSYLFGMCELYMNRSKKKQKASFPRGNQFKWTAFEQSQNDDLLRGKDREWNIFTAPGDLFPKFRKKAFARKF